MMRWLRELWTGSEPAEFESTFSVVESVERLKAATGRSFLSALTEERATGTVKALHVSLQRSIPMFGSAFKPFFRGRFVERDGRVLLTGRFAIHWVVRAFMACWFGTVILIPVAISVAHPEAAAAMLPGAAMMAALALALVRLGQWFARNDAAWLEAVIRNALSRVDPAAVLAEVSMSPEQPPIIAGAAMLLALVGVVGGAAAFGATPSSSRAESAAFAAFALALAYGVFQRRLLAWRAFFVFLGLGWADSVWRMTRARGQELPRPLFPAFVVLDQSTLRSMIVAMPMP